MFRIGEYAALTGLSVKALRHYDEKGVLVPADVDDRSSYRRYADSQVRAGVVVRLLRSAGVPVPAVSAAIASGDAEQTLRSHRLGVLEEREREDRAFLAAEDALAALAAPVEVRERAAPAQPFLSRSLSVPLEDDAELSDDDVNEAFAAVFAEVRAAGLGPSGPFWTAMRAGERGTVELVGCWPTSSLMDEGAGATESSPGVLPARRELVATWRPPEGVRLPEGVLHPAIVGLFDAAGERGLRLDGVEIRQTVVGQDPEEPEIEVALTISG